MKILAIGNSFSQDATRFLQQIAKAGGFQAEVVNLYIGGCSLQRHWKNFREDKRFYSYELNGNETGKFISIKDALNEGDWDVITLQQVSTESGVYKSYYPYIFDLYSAIKLLAPSAKIWLHETWSYDHFSSNPDFKLYNKDSDYMYSSLQKTYRKVADDLKISIIPTGDVLQTLRKKPMFDLLSGGMSLCRDSCHLSLDYGRYMASAVWYETLFGGDIRDNSYKLPMKNVNQAVLHEIRETVHDCCRR